jgi:hypothetical protein
MAKTVLNTEKKADIGLELRHMQSQLVEVMYRNRELQKTVYDNRSLLYISLALNLATFAFLAGLIARYFSG